jgi:Cu/Ag efflux pump CusA
MNISTTDVFTALEKTCSGYIYKINPKDFIRAEGKVNSDIEQIVVKTVNGLPIM